MYRSGYPFIRARVRSIEKTDSLFSSSKSTGGIAAPPTTNTNPTTSSEVPPATSGYGYISEFFNSIVSKVESPLNYLSVGATSSTATNQTKSETKTTLIQRANENRVSRSEVTAKTRALIKKLMIAESNQSNLFRINELSQHILDYPPTRIIAAQEKRLIAKLLDNVLHSTDVGLREESRQCLTLIGVHPPPKGKGVNLLTIDGGGTRGMMGLEVLEQIERISGKKICEIFDIICGVSTGGIIAGLLTVKRYTVKECREMYMESSKKLFSQGKFQGGYGLLRNHSYYNTTLWINILKEIIGEDVTLISTSRKLNTPRLAIIASIVNLPTLQPYVFRNYEHPAGRDSHYRGGAESPLWTAIQASAAAPFYFQEVKLDQLLLQDGGIYANNPTAIAFHETKLLWPSEPVNCVVSVGNGRTVTDVEVAPTRIATSLQDKISKIVDSATDTEGVHLNVHDMLPDNVYYRFNPYMTTAYGLDEIDPERLEQMSNDAKLYVRRNISKIEGATERLCQKPSYNQRIHRWIKDTLDLRGFYKPA